MSDVSFDSGNSPIAEKQYAALFNWMVLAAGGQISSH